MGQLDGKTIIITGAAQGMGAVHARRCVEEGARVILTDLQADAGQALAAELGDDARFVEQDVTSESDWDRVVDEATTQFGGIDGLVNNAAIWWTKPVLEEDATNMMKMLEVNVIGTWQGVRKVAPKMAERGGGSIVNLSSIAGTRGIPEHAAYGASKWAVRGLSKVAADGTGMFLVPEEEREELFALQPLPRPARREEISGLLIFLLSDQSSYVTGHEHVIDGGRTVW
jgi:3alpha(or 20beta)-hydroxysteroid dehydrogenase